MGKKFEPMTKKEKKDVASLRKSFADAAEAYTRLEKAIKASKVKGVAGPLSKLRTRLRNIELRVRTLIFHVKPGFGIEPPKDGLGRPETKRWIQ
jgi:hypothetical protein